MIHRLIVAIRTWLDAFRHVQTGGKTTRTRAVRRATRPPDRCPSCRQPVPHSPDWQDHLH